METMEVGQKEGIKTAEVRATQNIIGLNGKGGTNFGDSAHDGAYVEFPPDPPLRILLYLMGTLFLDLEALWWVYRRGTADRARPRRSRQRTVTIPMRPRFGRGGRGNFHDRGCGFERWMFGGTARD